MAKKIEETASKQVNEAPKISLKSIHSQTVLAKINKKINVENNRTSITKKLWYVAAFFLLIVISGFMEIIDIHPAIVMLSIFFSLSSFIISFMFKSREKKLQKLINGEDLLASWTLTETQKKKYVNYLFQHEKNKNTIILYSIGTIAIVVFGIFILVIDEGKLYMFLVLVGLIAFLSLFAYGMPFYYKMKNSKADGQVLIGSKYAYINGFFHNWDFVLSGLSKVEIMTEPFYGINLIYYYTDRTFTHSEELFIPANEETDLEELIENLKKINTKPKKRKKK